MGSRQWSGKLFLRFQRFLTKYKTKVLQRKNCPKTVSGHEQNGGLSTLAERMGTGSGQCRQ